MYWTRLSLEDYFDHVLHYLTNACGDQDNVDQLLDAIIHELPEQESKIVTYGQQLIQRGMHQGMHQGIQQGAEQKQKDIAKNLLHEGFDISRVAKLTGLSPDLIKNLI